MVGQNALLDYKKMVCTFSEIYNFYFNIVFEELTFYQKCSIKCVGNSLFYIEMRGKIIHNLTQK